MSESDEGPRLSISETDYQLWRHHPVSKVVLQYLRDYRAMLIKDTIARWESGTIDLSREQEARGRSVTCLELAELPFEAIREFYDGEKSDNAAEAS